MKNGNKGLTLLKEMEELNKKALDYELFFLCVEFIIKKHNLKSVCDEASELYDFIVSKRNMLRKNQI